MSVRSPIEDPTKCEKFEAYAANPAARSHVGAHLPAENGSLHGIAAIHAQAGRAPRDHPAEPQMVRRIRKRFATILTTRNFFLVSRPN